MASISTSFLGCSLASALAWTRVRNRKLRGPFQLFNPTQGMYVCTEPSPGGSTRGMYVCSRHQTTENQLYPNPEHERFARSPRGRENERNRNRHLPEKVPAPAALSHVSSRIRYERGQPDHCEPSYLLCRHTIRTHVWDRTSSYGRASDCVVHVEE